MSERASVRPERYHSSSKANQASRSRRVELEVGLESGEGLGEVAGLGINRLDIGPIHQPTRLGGLGLSEEVGRLRISASETPASAQGRTRGAADLGDRRGAP